MRIERLRSSPQTVDAPHSPSRLLTLPPELRNKIYELTLLSNTKIKITDIEGKRTWHLPPLLQANRQLRAEAAGIYYSVNIFTFNMLSQYPHHPSLCDPKKLRLLQRWLHFLGPGIRDSLTRIDLEATVYLTQPGADEVLSSQTKGLAVAGLEVKDGVLRMEVLDHREEGERRKHWYAGSSASAILKTGERHDARVNMTSGAKTDKPLPPAPRREGVQMHARRPRRYGVQLPWTPRRPALLGAW